MAFEALSPLSGFAQMFGGNQPPAQPAGTPPPAPGAGGLSGGINNFISALMKGYQSGHPADAPSTGPGYEGNIPSPANPFSGGQFGMPGQAAAAAKPNVPQAGQWAGHAQPPPFQGGNWPGHAQPVPFLGQTTGPQPNPFMSGTSPFQFGNNPMMSALFNPPGGQG